MTSYKATQAVRLNNHDDNSRYNFPDKPDVIARVPFRRDARSARRSPGMTAEFDETTTRTG
jgi:hypothetical protein